MAEQLPTQFFILGGGGDLAQRKLFPALFDLYTQQLLPHTFQIIGLARTKRSDEEYQTLIKESILKQQKNYDQASIDSFCAHARYVSGSFEEKESYGSLLSAVETFESFAGKKANKLFYLAVPPVHYEHIFTLLHESGIAQQETKGAWSRILVEKPFGHDRTSAIALDSVLQGLFEEDQIFRIDHYLAKEAIQNLLSFRFGNTLIKHAWNKEHIEAVHITMFESINVSSRGAFYDKVGALRDVGQNHLLQMLALIAMDEPATFTADAIRQQRAAILTQLVPLTQENIITSVRRAQYDGYKDIPGVDQNSNTETYFEFKAHLDTPVWAGVPFYVRAGKALRNDEVTIRIDFKEVESGAFKTGNNAIVLTVSPVQSMNITLNVKKPGHGFEIEQNTLSFAWDDEHRGIVNAYEKVILDCINGERTLFTNTNEVLASWEFISSITDHWEQVPLQTYQEGSSGPTSSLDAHTEGELTRT